VPMSSALLLLSAPPMAPLPLEVEECAHALLLAVSRLGKGTGASNSLVWPADLEGGEGRPTPALVGERREAWAASVRTSWLRDGPR
jgi:hypothetical protein